MASFSDSESEEFLSQVERVRIEIRDKFSKSHQMLHEREAALLSELDQLVANYKVEEVRKQIQKISSSKESIISALKENEDYEALQLSIATLNSRIRELEVSLETRMRRVELDWDGGLEGRLREIGGIRIIGQLDYKKKGEPVMTAFIHSKYPSTEAGVFRFPASLTIEPHSQNIYICDRGNNRVQVFSNSLEFIFCFSDKMLGPSGICIDENFLYVTQYGSNCLNVYTIEGNLLKSFGKKGKNELEFDIPNGVEVSEMKNRIYICEYNNNRVQCLYLNLTFNSFILDILGPRDIKLTQNEIVVLKGGYSCICLFNYLHQFVREMIRCGEGTPLTIPLFFCLDQQNNILMTDFHCVAIFSFRGELIHIFGKEGERQYPKGIILNSENKIVVLSENPTNCMQLF